jgi:hypothetical protein
MDTYKKNMILESNEREGYKIVKRVERKRKLQWQQLQVQQRELGVEFE